MVRVAPINLTFNPRTLWFDPGDLDIEKDMPVVVRTARGTEFGIAASEVIEVSEEQVRALKSALRPVERIATEEDIEQAAEMERASAEALPVFKEMAREYHEDMHPVSVEFLLDGDKAVFYFEAEERIDFRELVRKLAARFHVRIDMRQIGVRDEARMVGGIGHCGQELCCKRLGGEFCPVSIRMAKEQGLSLNPQKISGLCGRLMCCLRYEFDAYKDFKSRAPKLNATVQTPAGPAKVVDHDVPREIVSLKVEGEKPVKVPLSEFDPAPEGATRPNAVGEEACFTMYFRDYPFKGGYAVACGMAQLADLVETFRFSEEDIAYLASLDAPAGGPLFDPAFLEYLRDLRLSVDIDAMPEGTIVFPHEPLVRVTGPIMQCQLIETALLNMVNFQTLIATKAARVCRAAKGRPVAEFGLRRAQGLGGVWASRAAVVGGCASTSNVLAGKLFDIPVSGTHAHSWVMSFDDELTAFREYARIFPNNCILLVDTYDVEQGIRNAITVGLEMRERGERLAGIRIDSGDLSWLSKMARRMLDEAGLTDCGIVLSNDLDEYTIQSMLEEGADVMSFGVGTKLASAYDQPTLGGVYKLAAVRVGEDAPWTARLKISESAAKLTTPGVLDVRRYYQSDGRIAGDMVFDVNETPDAREVIVDPMDDLRQKNLSGLRFETLLRPLARVGKVVLAPEDRSAMAARSRACVGLETLDETQLRMLNPHTYPVGLELGLNERRRALVAELRHIL